MESCQSRLVNQFSSRASLVSLQSLSVRDDISAAASQLLTERERELSPYAHKRQSSCMATRRDGGRWCISASWSPSLWQSATRLGYVLGVCCFSTAHHCSPRAFFVSRPASRSVKESEHKE